MLAEYDRLDAPGARGALLRREGLYHSHIQNWRKVAEAPQAPVTHGNRASVDAGESARNRKLKKENARLQAGLAKSQAVAEAMGKLAGILESLSGRPGTDT